MNVNPVSIGNYTAGAYKPVSKNCVAFCGKQETDTVEIGGKSPDKTPLLKSVLGKLGVKTGYERDMKIQRPYALDMAEVRAGILPRRVAALCLRYGNSDISNVAPEVIEKVKAHLTETGIEVKDKNFRLLKIADSDKARIIVKQISYYDENEDKSIIFTENGEPNYKIRYEYDKLGAIKDYDMSDIYFADEKKWEET